MRQVEMSDIDTSLSSLHENSGGEKKSSEKTDQESKTTPLLRNEDQEEKKEDEEVVLAMGEEEDQTDGDKKIVTVKKKIFRGDTRVSPGEFYRLKALTHDLNKIRKKMSVTLLKICNTRKQEYYR